MRDFDFEIRKDQVYYSPPHEAAKLVWDWIKSGTITLRQFKGLIHLIDTPGE